MSTTESGQPLGLGLGEGLGPLPDSDWTGGTLAYTAEQMRAYALQERAAERALWTEAVMSELDGNGQALAIVAHVLGA
jgi:hypothetical protein